MSQAGSAPWAATPPAVETTRPARASSVYCAPGLGGSSTRLPSPSVGSCAAPSSLSANGNTPRRHSIQGTTPRADAEPRLSRSASVADDGDRRSDGGAFLQRFDPQVWHTGAPPGRPASASLSTVPLSSRGQQPTLSLIPAELLLRERESAAPQPPEAPVLEDDDLTETQERLIRRIQRVWRGAATRTQVRKFIEYNYSKGNLDEAARHASAQVKKDAGGAPFPLNTPLANFRGFGEAVDAYMHFVYRCMNLFFALFLLSLPCLIDNLEGHDMGSQLNLLTSISLGNTDRLRTTDAVMEFVISGVLVCWLFYARANQLSETYAARTEQCTPADFTVMLSGLPPECTEASALADWIGSLGRDGELHDVVALSLSLDVRDVILLVNEKEQLRTSEHSLQAQLFLCRRELNALLSNRSPRPGSCHGGGGGGCGAGACGGAGGSPGGGAAALGSPSVFGSRAGSRLTAVGEERSTLAARLTREGSWASSAGSRHTSIAETPVGAAAIAAGAAGAGGGAGAAAAPDSPRELRGGALAIDAKMLPPSRVSRASSARKDSSASSALGDPIGGSGGSGGGGGSGLPAVVERLAVPLREAARWGRAAVSSRAQHAFVPLREDLSEASVATTAASGTAPSPPPAATVPSAVVRDRQAARLQRQLAKIQTRLGEARRKLAEHDETLGQLMQRQRHCTGFAFVTFNDEASTLRCMELINGDAKDTDDGGSAAGGGGGGGGDGGSDRASGGGGGGGGGGLSSKPSSSRPSFMGAALKAERPPEPEEVYWDQMEFGHPELVKRQLWSSAVLGSIAIVGTAIIAFANFGMGPIMTNAGSVTERIVMQVTFTVMIILGNIFIFILTPILASNVERHYTFGGKELSCFCKMFAFQVFNTVVASSVFFLFSDSFTHARHSWYQYGSGMILNVLVGDLFVINLGIDLGRPDILIARHLLAKRLHTQREMNQMFAPRADIYLAFRLQLITKFIVVTLLYSTALPICYGFCCAFMWVTMWIDRYNLLRRLVPPPRSPDSLISLILVVIFPIAIAFHLLGHVAFYAFTLDVMRHDPTCDATGALPTYCDPDVAQRSPAELDAPCQTEESLLQAARAVRVACTSLALWGACLGYYVWREATRPRQNGIHLIGDDLVASYVDVITVQHSVKGSVLQEDDQTVKGALAQRYNTFRGANGLRLYMPPLPTHVMQALRTATALDQADEEDSASPSGQPSPSPRASRALSQHRGSSYIGPASPARLTSPGRRSLTNWGGGESACSPLAGTRLERSASQISAAGL